MKKRDELRNKELLQAIEHSSRSFVHFALFGGRKCVLERSLCGA